LLIVDFLVVINAMLVCVCVCVEQFYALAAGIFLPGFSTRLFSCCLFSLLFVQRTVSLIIYLFDYSPAVVVLVVVVVVVLVVVFVDFFFFGLLFDSCHKSIKYPTRIYINRFVYGSIYI